MNIKESIMKKMLFILNIALVCLLYSCDKEDSDNTRYLDNKLIEGTWIGTTKNNYYTIDSTIYIFKDNKMSREFYARISGLETLKYEGKFDYGNYLLTDNLILASQPTGMKFMYKLSNHNDSLYLASTTDNPMYWNEFKKLEE